MIIVHIIIAITAARKKETDLEKMRRSGKSPLLSSGQNYYHRLN